MSTAQEIKAAIDALPRAERGRLERLLRQPVKAKRPMVLPYQAARRRKIFGNRVLPNLVLEAREQERA